MYIKYGKLDYKINWEHSPQGGFTVCRIQPFMDLPEVGRFYCKDTIYTAISFLNPKDGKYQKSIGRSVSLGKAVEKIDNKRLRDKIVKEFNNSDIKKHTDYIL